jgi:hypothetical protein
VQKRLANGEPLRLEDFDFHWFFTKPIDGTHPFPDPINLTQNPRAVQAKDRPKGFYGKGKALSLTERDSSHWEVIEAQITGDGSQLKGIHRQRKKRGRPIGIKTPPKVTAVKRKTAAKKRKTTETLDLTGDDPIEASESSENEKSDERDQEEGQEKDMYEGFIHIDDFPPFPPPPRKKKPITYISDISSDEEASLKRPRRSSYARRAPKKSL